MSIRDIAQAVGVAPSTVSLVLNGKKGVAEKTAAAIRRELDRQNYRPGTPGRPRKRAGAAKTRHRTHRLALVAWHMPHARLHTPIYSAVVTGVEQAVAEAEKTFVLRHVLPDEAGNGDVLAGRVDGAILFGAVNAQEECVGGMPCVQVMGWKSDSASRCDRVSYDDRRVGELAAGYLLEDGHRHVAFIGTASPGAGDVPRGDAFLRTTGEAGCTAHVLWDDSLFEETGNVQTVNHERMDAIVGRLEELTPRPTGIFVHADALTQCLYPTLIEHGLRPGDDVEIVSCNNEEILLNGLHPRPATIDIHASDIGRQAVVQLLRRLEHPDEPRIEITVEPELVRSE